MTHEIELLAGRIDRGRHRVGAVVADGAQQLRGNVAGHAADPSDGAEALPPRSDPAPRAFESIDARRRGYVTREDLDQLKDREGFDAADTNRDGRLDASEFQRFWDATNKPK